MAKDTIDIFIEEVSSFLKSRYKEFRGIYFFGSRVKGNYTLDSDYDLAFVFENEIDWKFEKEIKYIIYEFESKFEILVDPKIVSDNEINDPVTPLLINIKNEGVFYAAQ